MKASILQSKQQLVEVFSNPHVLAGQSTNLNQYINISISIVNSSIKTNTSSTSEFSATTVVSHVTTILKETLWSRWIAGTTAIITTTTTSVITTIIIIRIIIILIRITIMVLIRLIMIIISSRSSGSHTIGVTADRTLQGLFFLCWLP